MDVAAIIVTRGDQDIRPVLASLPEEWEQVVWDNSKEVDLGVYGRYAAIRRTDAEIIYVQDDDCIVSHPRTIVDGLKVSGHKDGFKGYPEYGWSLDMVVCNMPPEFRHSFYEEHALVGFGAAFHRDAPFDAFGRFADAFNSTPTDLLARTDMNALYLRTCDIVFTGMTPRVLVDVPKVDMPWAHYEDRMWKQPEHQADRVRMLDIVREIQ